MHSLTMIFLNRNHVRSIVLGGGAMWNLLVADNSLIDSGGLFMQPHQLQRDPAVPRVPTGTPRTDFRREKRTLYLRCSRSRRYLRREQELLGGSAASLWVCVWRRHLVKPSPNIACGDLCSDLVCPATDRSAGHPRSFLLRRSSSAKQHLRHVPWRGRLLNLASKTYHSSFLFLRTSLMCSSSVGFVNSACFKLASSIQPDASSPVPLLFGSVYQNNAVQNAPAALLIGPSATFTSVMCMKTESVKLQSQLQSTSFCPSYGIQARNTASRLDGLCAADEWKIARVGASKKAGKKLSLIVSIVVIVGVALGIAVLVGACFGIHEWREGSAEARRARKRARKQMLREERGSASALSNLLLHRPFHYHHSSEMPSASSSPRSSMSRDSVPTTDKGRSNSHDSSV